MEKWRKKVLHVFSEGFLKNLRKMKKEFNPSQLLT